jgi:hypothetical protein
VSAAHRFALRCARDDGDQASSYFIRLQSARIASVADQYRGGRKLSDKSGDKVGDNSADKLSDNDG